MSGQTSVDFFVTFDADFRRKGSCAKESNQIWDKKLSYRRETARQLPTWRGLSPPVHSPPPSGYTPMRMVESETRNKRRP